MPPIGPLVPLTRLTSDFIIIQLITPRLQASRAAGHTAFHHVGHTILNMLKISEDDF